MDQIQSILIERTSDEKQLKKVSNNKCLFSDHDVIKLNYSKAAQLPFTNCNKNQDEQSQHNFKNHKSYYQQRQKNRIQRENWILKLFKSIKMLTQQNKKAMLSRIKQIMGLYVNVSNFDERLQNISQSHLQKSSDQQKISEKFINMFIIFFNSKDLYSSFPISQEQINIESKQQNNRLKSIIRPNNNFIYTDLIKLFLEYSRNRFKKIISKAFNESHEDYTMPIINKAKSLVLIKPLKSQGEKHQLQKQKEVETIKQKQIPKLSTDQHIKQFLYEKYENFIKNFNENIFLQRINDTYFDLYRLNEQNSTLIEKYKEKCFGKKKNINYDYDGLYTKAEKQKIIDSLGEMVRNQKEKETSNFLYAKPSEEAQYYSFNRNGNIEMRQVIFDYDQRISAQRLKEYFKIKTEVFQREGMIARAKNLPNKTINSWMKMSLFRTGNQYNPLTIMINIDQKTHFQPEKYEQLYNKPFKRMLYENLQQLRKKQYHKQKNQKKPNNHFRSQSEKKFRKQLFIDFKGLKTKELICSQQLECIKKAKNNYKKYKQQTLSEEVRTKQVEQISLPILIKNQVSQSKQKIRSRSQSTTPGSLNYKNKRIVPVLKYQIINSQQISKSIMELSKYDDVMEQQLVKKRIFELVNRQR